ncbi:hypothetical protein Tco_0862902 [Tanacetum coccineum]
MDFVRFALLEREIHSFMIQIRILSMILQTFSTTLHSPSTRHTHCQPWHQNYVEPNPSNSYGFDQTPHNSIDHQPQSIQEDLNQQRMNDVLKAMQSLVEKLRQQEQAANLSTHTPEPSRHFNFIYDDDDDDDDNDDNEESTIPFNEIITQIPPSIAITPVLPTMEPEESLNIGDEHLSNIPKKESDEVINARGNSVTISNMFFYVNDDFTSSDDESFPDEDVAEENFKTYSNPLFKFDEEYISSDVNPLFNEVLEDIESKDSYVSNLDEQALLVTHLSKLNEDECFDP